MQALGWLSSLLKRSWVRNGVVAVFAAGFSAQAFAVRPATTTTLTATTVGTGPIVMLTATVVSGATPVEPGTVNFCDAAINATCTGRAFVGSAQLMLTGTPGTATISVQSAPGAHSYLAVFPGTNLYQPSSSSAHAYTSAAIFPTATSFSYLGSGGTYTFQTQVAAINGNNAGPTGTIRFRDITAGTTVATANLSTGTGPTYQFSFGSPQNANVGVYPFAVATGDFNGDGLLDAVVNNVDDNDVSILLGKGDGTFQTQTTVSVGTAPSFVAVGDFNSDGKLDLAVTNANDNNVQILFGDGTGHFTTANTYATGQTPNMVYVADFNNDGILDLAVPDDLGGGIIVLLGNSDGTFQSAIPKLVGSHPDDLAAADFDGDGILDLISINSGDATISFLKGNGDGTFVDAVAYPVGNSPGGIVISDVDGDGKLDVITANLGDSTLSLLRGVGDGTFQTQTNLNAPSFPFWIVGGDLDGDGKTDLAVVGDFGITFYLGAGDGTFPNSSSVNISDESNIPVIGDFNGDGLLDLAVTNLLPPSSPGGSPTNNELVTLLNTAGSSVTNTVQVSGLAANIGDNVDADYLGDALDAGSVSGAFVLNSIQNTTSLALASSSTFLTSGGSATLTAILTPSSASGVSTDGETVTFFKDGTAIGTPVALSGGVATISTGALTASHTFSVVYSGDTYFTAANSNTLSEFVTLDTTTTLSILQGATPVTTAPLGAVITLSATVKKTDTSAVISGTVNFCDTVINATCTGSALVGTAQLTHAGVASIQVRLPFGTHSLQAVFFTSGSGGGNGSSSTVHSFNVTGVAPTVTTLTAYGSNGNYFLYSTVSGLPFAGSSVLPTGNVSFIDTGSGTPVVLGTPIDLSTGTSSTSPLFTPQPLVMLNNTPVGVVLADLNHDGFLDAIVTVPGDNPGTPNDKVAVLMGNGDGTFNTETDYSTDGLPTAIVVGDFNGDGKLDVATANIDTNTVSILLGNGDGTLQASVPYPAGFGPQLMVLGDFNRDGNLDIAAIDNGSPQDLILLLGKGDGTFQPEQDIALPGNMANIATGDFNGDGLTDLIFPDFTNGDIAVYLSNGDGTFQTPVTTVIPFSISLTVGDFNGDGKLDAATVAPFDFIHPSNQNGTLTVFPGNGDGTFGASTPAETGYFAANAFTGDFNGDGKTDIVVLTQTGNAVVMLNDGTGAFPTQQPFPIGSNGAIFAGIGDLNGDGRPELVTANAQEPDLSVLLYTSGTTITLPPEQVTVSTGTPHFGVAQYSGDTNFAGSSSVPVDLTTDNLFPDTLTLQANKVFLNPGDTITYTATLNPASFNGASTDGEPILFLEGGATPIGSMNLSGGVASLTLNASALAAGPQSITALYQGDTFLAGNSSAAIQTNVLVASTTALAITDLGGHALSTVAANTAILLTATVSAGTATNLTGTVVFCDTNINLACKGNAILGTAQLTSSSTAAIATILPIGPHSLKTIFKETQLLTSSASTPAAFTVSGNYIAALSLSESGTMGNYTLTGVLSANSTAALLPTGTISFLDTSASNAVIGSTPLSSAVTSTQLGLVLTSTPSANSTPYFVAKGDFNGDGILDLAVTNNVDPFSGPSNVSILIGNGLGGFALQPTTYETGFSSVDIAAADFNGDGFLDLVVSNSDDSDSSISVLLGNGDGTFHPEHHIPVGFGSPEGLRVGDFNSDGALDVAVADAENNQVFILLGIGDGNFNSAQGYDVGDLPVSVSTADLNGDGILDLVVPNVGDNTDSILLGNGDGTFQAQTTVNTGNSPDWVAIADFNGDGKADLATLNSGVSNGSVSVRLGNGDGTFGTFHSFAVGANASMVLAVDMDGDSKLDLVVDNDSDDNLSVLIGNGDGTFNPQQTFHVGTGPIGIAAGDFDSDGRIDIASVNDLDNQIGILLNGSTLLESFTATGIAVTGTGTHQVKASYPGDTFFHSALSNPANLDAGQIVTALALASSANPTTPGNTVTLTATLTPFSGGGQTTDTQTVQFFNGAALIGTGTLTSGVATVNFTVPTALGSYSITAVYGGNANFAMSTSAPLIENIQFTSSIWVANFDGTLSQFNDSGTTTTPITAGGTGIAFDASGNLWSINSGSGSLAELNSSGSALHADLSGGGLFDGKALAIDGSGFVWIANTNNSISVFDNTGAAVTPSTGYTGGGINNPNSIAIDSSGNVWIANGDNNSVTEVIGAAAPVVTPLATAVQNQQLGVKP